VRDVRADNRTNVSSSNELFIRAVRYVVPRPWRNWLRSPSRSLEWIWDNAKFSAGITRKLSITPDVAITLHPRAFRVAYENQVVDPDQSAEFKNFIAQCNSKMLLFDIGAHYGLFSLAAAGLRAKAVAVDPSAEAIRMIARQVELNHGQQMIRAVHAAVSESKGSLKMLNSGAFSNGYFRLAAGRSARELTEIQATTIDEMTAEFGTPTHIKIDVEGHEAAVVRGGRETLRRYSPQLFLELHNELILMDGGDPGEVVDELQGAGYSVFSLDGDRLERNAILGLPLNRVVARREQVLSDDSDAQRLSPTGAEGQS
jgi:FkbM family methyltransferase